MCFFMGKGEEIMPRNQFQRMVFAFLTVLVTVHGYVFYSLYVVNGNTLMPAVRNKFSSFITSIAFSRFYPVIHFSQINKLCYAHLIAVLAQCSKFVDKYLVVSSSIQPPPVLK